MNGSRVAGLVSAAVLLSAMVGCSSSAPLSYDAKAPSSSGYGQQGYGQPAPAQQPGGWFGGGSAEPAPMASATPWGDSTRQAPQAEESTRPGLGTEWGETLNSRITSTAFVRADSSSPFSAVGMFYNDASGARAMAKAAGTPSATSGMFSVSGGIVSMGLRDENGHFLSGFTSGGNNYVAGDAGTRYTIVLRNRSQFRFEVVLSVDGLDVLDGKAASFSKRGYILDALGELEVDGFRQSMDQVAAFRFGTVSDSYAGKKTGETRNVGVIGVALFHERGSDPWSWNNEVAIRHKANPFPGQFATPP